MKIIDSISRNKGFISFEFFPPKQRKEWPAFFQTVEQLARLNPLFASVTYGAGGSAHAESLEIVTRLQREYGLETMAHLTCIGSKTEDINRFLNGLTAAGVDNVLALRGDLPMDESLDTCPPSSLQCASDLVSLISEAYPALGIGVAGYTEVHPEAASIEEDLSYLKQKLDSG